MIKKFHLENKTFGSPDTGVDAVLGLWKINEIILTTTEKSKLYNKIVNVMLEELGYLKLGYVIIVLSLLNKNKTSLKRVSICETPHANEALKRSPVKFENISLKTDDKENLSIKALDDNHAYVTDDLSDMLAPVIDRNVVRQVQSNLGIQSSVVVPIIARNEKLGTLIFSLNKNDSEINEFEKQIMVGFANATGVAISQSSLFSKLETVNRKLIDLDKQKNEFINMAAHELRAPITAIKGYISMIMEGDAGVIPEKAVGYLNDVNSVNERLIRLVNNMLNVSRIEEGRLIYNTEVVKLSDIAKSLYVSFKFEAERKGLKFSMNVAEGINDKVEVDPDRLNEVVGNFVSNSVKYTENGEISINISQPSKDKIYLGVKDTGPGISKEEQDKLFQKFYRVESTAGKTIGTGLGLYISKLLIEKFSGKIGLKSEPGKGSEFWFELPVSEKSLTTDEEHSENENKNEIELKNLREKEKKKKSELSTTESGTDLEDKQTMLHNPPETKIIKQ